MNHAVANRTSAGESLAASLVGNRQLLVRCIIDNNYPAVARNMQEALDTSATFTPRGLENIINRANTPEQVALMDQVLNVPWIMGTDPGMDRAVMLLQQRAQDQASGSAAGLRAVGADVVAGGLLGLVGLVGGLITAGKDREEAERAAREAASAQARAAEKRRQLLIIAGLSLVALIIVFTLYRLAR